MKFASAVTHCEQWVEHRDASAVVDGIIDQLDEQLDGQAPDLLIFFNASSPMVPLHGRDVAQELRERCAARWETSSPVVLGASWGSGGPGTGVIGGPARTTGCHEIQESAALTVLGASLPSVKVMPFFANPDHDSLPTLIGGSWAELALLPEAETPHVILFSDPSQFGLGPYSDTILKYFDNALPFSTKVGGLVPGGGLISLDYQGCKTAVGTQGVGGVVLQGDIEVDTLVCQGAAPFGPVFEVTACQGPTVFGLDGEPAAKKVIDMLEQGRQRRAAAGQAAAAAAPPPNDSATGEAGQAAAGGAAAAAEQWEADDGLDAEEEYDWDIEPENTLHILAGVEVDGNPTRGELDLPSVSTDGGEEALSEKGSQHRGSVRISSDYVVRHIVQVDPSSGGIQLDLGPELLQEGMRLQLHAFTREAARDEVSAHAKELAEMHSAAGLGQPAGALLVSCLGRGRYLYGEEGVETAALAEAFAEIAPAHGPSGDAVGEPGEGGVPTAGFFAGGEIGPVGYRSYTHSYTSSLAVFRPRYAAATAAAAAAAAR